MRSKFALGYNRTIFVIVTALFAVMVLTGAASAQAETSKDVVISGETGLKWVNTGITVAAGDTVRLEAKGTVDVGGTWGIHGPEGTTNFSEQPPGYYPLETKMRYGLAARITLGSARKYAPTQTWVYGEAKEIKVKRSGILWLTCNDDAPEGNVGEFAVKITIIKNAK
ncbi:MAG TPA: hypothetical protein VK468_07040 [Pyrinomonadaceae bacterium]|nr:hypothetical protein [Pyrinomonadaceae bacterium]